MSAHNNMTINEKNPTMEEAEQHHFKDMDLMEETNKEKGANVQGDVERWITCMMRFSRPFSRRQMLTMMPF
jgi:hypothetical protein